LGILVINVMPRVRLNKLPHHLKLELLKMLEQMGAENLKNDLYKSLLHVLPRDELDDKEFLSRYLLLVSILDQQAESDSARRTVVEIYKNFGREFFMNPRKYVTDLDPVISLAIKVYQPKTRFVRIKSEGIILLRVGGFLLAMISIERRHRGLVAYLKSRGSPREMLSAILNDIYLRGLLYEKAARMYVGWISHPKLFVNLFDGAVHPSSIPMVVNGHVCKVLARTGFLDSVLVEEGEPIVKAEDERRRIESLVRGLYPQGDYFMIDYGAFYIGTKFCDETNPKCGICPIKHVCMRNVDVRAY